MAVDAQPGEDSTVVLRRQSARMVEGRPEDGYTGTFEVISCACGDHPYLDYSEVSPELQRICGPYLMGGGIAAYEEHLGLQKEREAAHWTRRWPMLADWR